MIKIEEGGGAGVVTLTRPDKRNALDNEGYQRLAASLLHLDSRPQVRSIIMTGAGATFCSGTDLTKLELEWPQAPNGPVMRLLQAIAGLEKPLIAAVNGPAVGLGATILLHCDWVVIGEDAWLSFPFARLGIAPEAGSTKLLPERVGYLRAMELLLTGRQIDGGEAVALGLATSIHPDPVAEARRVARHIASLADESVVAHKAGLASERKAFHLLWKELNVINGLLARRAIPSASCKRPGFAGTD